VIVFVDHRGISGDYGWAMLARDTALSLGKGRGAVWRDEQRVPLLVIAEVP